MSAGFLFEHGREKVEKPACRRDRDKQESEENGDEPIGHHLPEHDELRQTGGDARDAEGERGAEGKPLQKEVFHDGHDARDICVEGKADQNGGGHAPEAVGGEVLEQPAFGNPAVDESCCANADEDPFGNSAQNVAGFRQRKGVPCLQAETRVPVDGLAGGIRIEGLKEEGLQPPSGMDGVNEQTAENADQKPRCDVEKRQLPAEQFPSRTTATSLMTGEVIRKAMVIPNGIPPAVKPMKSGTLEHEQKGVMAPKSAPRP